MSFLHKDPNKQNAKGQETRWRTHYNRAKGKILKVKPDGTRVIRDGRYRIIKKKPEELK